MLNKSGERTQPCRTPTIVMNQSDSSPSTLTALNVSMYAFSSIQTTSLDIVLAMKNSIGYGKLTLRLPSWFCDVAYRSAGGARCRGVYPMLAMKQLASLTSQGGIEKRWCFWVQGGNVSCTQNEICSHTVQPASNIVFCERNHQPTVRQTAFLLYKLTVSIKKALGRPTRRGFSWCDDPPKHPAPFVRLQSVAAAASAARLWLQSGPLVLWDWDYVVSGRILDFLK